MELREFDNLIYQEWKASGDSLKNLSEKHKVSKQFVQNSINKGICYDQWLSKQKKDKHSNKKKLTQANKKAI